MKANERKTYNNKHFSTHFFWFIKIRQKKLGQINLRVAYFLSNTRYLDKIVYQTA